MREADGVTAPALDRGTPSHRCGQRILDGVDVVKSWRIVLALALPIAVLGCVPTSSDSETVPSTSSADNFVFVDPVTDVAAIANLSVAFGRTQIVVRYTELTVFEGTVDEIICATTTDAQRLTADREPQTGQLLDLVFVLQREADLSVTCTAENPLGDHVVIVDTDFVREGGVRPEDCTSGWREQLLPANLECRDLAPSTYSVNNVDAVVKFQSPRDVALGVVP